MLPTACVCACMSVWASVHVWVFWWDTASPVFFSFKTKRSIPPLFFPSLSSYQERTLYYHQYLLCSARRERNCSWAINPALTQGRIYFCPGWDKAGHREAHLFLRRRGYYRNGAQQPAWGNWSSSYLLLFTTSNRHRRRLICQLTPLLIHWFIYTEDLLQTELC